MVLFGPAGLADSFKAKGYKKSIQVADYLSEFGLTAFEYQCGRGVKIGTEAAKDLGNVLADKNIQVSLHAPYFISMSSLEEEKRLNSVNYILQSARHWTQWAVEESSSIPAPAAKSQDRKHWPRPWIPWG